MGNLWRPFFTCSFFLFHAQTGPVSKFFFSQFFVAIFGLTFSPSFVQMIREFVTSLFEFFVPSRERRDGFDERDENILVISLFIRVDIFPVFVCVAQEFVASLFDIVVPSLSFLNCSRAIFSCLAIFCRYFRIYIFPILGSRDAGICSVPFRVLCSFLDICKRIASQFELPALCSHCFCSRIFSISIT